MPAHVAPPEPEEVFGLACWRGQPGAMTAFHRHREIELNLVLRGSLTYLIGGRRLTVSAGQLALLWAAMPHRLMSSDPQTEVFWLTVPLGDVLTRFRRCWADRRCIRKPPTPAIRGALWAGLICSAHPVATKHGESCCWNWKRGSGDWH
ncbi:cupin domain-containing protein [Deinococcus sp. QL22]|uniref:cupin domain-containing protein n=1 Tax=Deinococcus sp. QL22 TaxID=2939437 RepID=UPI002017B53D|nr:cupin domain-containing protein [Deinococcus sp. QL22]UQN09735.1 cupin domain-containing protein [Deinococcus sp. QL22]